MYNSLPFIALIGLAAINTTANAAEKPLTRQQVPQAVQESFGKTYPNVKDVKYEEETKDGKARYEIEFKEKGKELEAVYGAEGNLIELTEKVEPAQLPSPVAMALKKSYPKAITQEAEKISKPDGTLAGYEVELRDGKKNLEIKLDAKGNIIKAEEEQEEQG